ncbi:hypothetical protein SLS57_006657 [Botryosphaeria dothidea]
MAPNLKLLSKKLSDVVDGFGETPDSQREEILKLTKDIRAEVENPVERIDDYVEILMEMGAIRLLMDWGAFERIPPPGSDGISYSDLAALVGADENLLRRMAWMLVSRGFLTQVSEDRVVHTKASAIFAEKESYAIYFKGRQAYLLHTPLHYNRILIFDVEPVESIYPNPALLEIKPVWDCIEGEQVPDFAIAMKVSSEIYRPTELFPFNWVAENQHLVPDDAALVVDVGGSYGDVLQMILKAFPGIPAGRVVLQDRISVIEEAEKLDTPALRGVRKMAHDFFTPQPLKGALVYYLRRIMHDWSDDRCRDILSNIRGAMGPESRILIHERVMSNPPSSNSAVDDLAMLNLGGKERTEADWRKLLGSVHLKILKIWRTEKPGGVSIIECMAER